MNNPSQSNKPEKPGKTGNQITDGGILKAIYRLSAPMLVSALLQNLQSLIDLFWVGRLGHTAIAGVAMGGTVLMILFPGLMGLATGAVAMVARAIGEGRPDKAAAAAAQSIIMAFLLGSLMAVIGWICADSLLRLLGAETDILAAGSMYLKISLAGSMPVFVLFIANASLQGAGDTKTPMLIMAVANALNIALDPLLIFGYGIIPALGVGGAAVATVAAHILAAAIVMRVLLRRGSRLYIRYKSWRPDLPLAWRIIRIGVPGSGQMLSRSLSSAVIMRIVAQFGSAAVAAYGAGMRFHMIILMPAFALGAAAATLTGQNLGAGKPDRARYCAWGAVAIDVGFMLVSAVAIMLFAPDIIGVFNDHPDVVRIGSEYLRVVSPFYVFAAVGIVISRATQGAGDTLMPMLITIVSLWGVQVPLALWLAYAWRPSALGIWAAMAVAFVVQGVLSALWFETGRWRRIRL